MPIIPGMGKKSIKTLNSPGKTALPSLEHVPHPSHSATWILPITEPGLSAPYQSCEHMAVL